MKIYVTDEAVDWLIEEMDLEAGDQVRFFPKYGGDSTFQQGFTVGMSLETAPTPEASIEKKDITFQVDQKDAWFFDGFDLEVVIKDDEVHFKKKED
ncbi:hypothetical protein FPQ10_05155 [Allobacillus sp. SKP2-8]|uniref:HesB/YadR/YfhF family protein n=1 Tax=unclassified Allobacillus TaxID=2628859 RepID=UPI0011835E49|nr:hypothetical protein [Allobacillus sp. SKP2-8]TSJ67942.1 hypothetical protein FPQ10_05155 [Allobacillus sp. SKP2-8]